MPRKKRSDIKLNERTPAWLEDKLARLVRFFPELGPGEQIVIRFGRRCRRRLGSLRLEGGTPLITLNGLYRHPFVPDYVVEATIAHELVHKVHGFGSPGPRLKRYPHRGGVVDRELERRGLDYITSLSKQWIDEHWWPFCAAQLGGE